MSDMVDTNDISQNLLKLGLDEKETRVYICLLDEPSMTILQVAHVINLPRTTVYRVVESLIKKRFAQWVIKENSKEIKATNVKNIENIVDEYKEQYQKALDAFGFLKKMGLNLMKKAPKTQVRYYQGAEGFKQMLWNTLHTQTGVVGYSQFGRIKIVGEIFYSKWVKEFRRKKLSDRAITSEIGLEYVKKHIFNPGDKHQLDESGVRFLPKSKFHVSGDHSIYDNIYAACYWKDDEVVGVEIENPEFVELHQSIFKILWDIAEPIEKYLKD